MDKKEESKSPLQTAYQGLNAANKSGSFTFDEAVLLKTTYTNLDNLLTGTNSVEETKIEDVDKWYKLLHQGLDKGVRQGTFSLTEAYVLKESMNDLHKKLVELFNDSKDNLKLVENATPKSKKDLTSEDQIDEEEDEKENEKESKKEQKKRRDLQEEDKKKQEHKLEEQRKLIEEQKREQKRRELEKELEKYRN